MNLKLLAKDTAVYGLSSIVGKFLNYLLVVLYSYAIPAQTGGYGVVTNLYAWTALLLALLTFGMETTFFRFSGKEGEDENVVFATALKMVGGVCAVFLVPVLLFLGPVSEAMGYAEHPEYIACFAIITVLDACQSIMFARLRQQGKALRFVTLKLSFIFASILLNLFVFLVLPHITGPLPEGGVGYIFLINLVCTSLVTFAFIPQIRLLKVPFDRALARRMLRYSAPLLLLSLVGILNQVADKILFPYLVPGGEGRVQLGIYGACTKIAMIMAMLTQAFRYAYEPIVFSSSKKKSDETEALVLGMKYFIIFGIFAYLAVMLFLPVLKYIIGSGYWEGLDVVPIVMAAELCMGIYFNLSFWYKLSDRTWWGALISAAGGAVMIAANIIFVPRFGYIACAWAGLAGYGTSMLLSWFIGRRKCPVPYDMKSAASFLALGAAIFFLSTLTASLAVVPGLCLNAVMLLGYLAAVYYFCIRKNK